MCKRSTLYTTQDDLPLSIFSPPEERRVSEAEVVAKLFLFMIGCQSRTDVPDLDSKAADVQSHSLSMKNSIRTISVDF